MQDWLEWWLSWTSQGMYRISQQFLDLNYRYWVPLKRCRHEVWIQRVLSGLVAEMDGYLMIILIDWNCYIHTSGNIEQALWTKSELRVMIFLWFSFLYTIKHVCLIFYNIKHTRLCYFILNGLYPSEYHFVCNSVIIFLNCLREITTLADG